MKFLGRLLIVVALLFAQTAGVAHEIWHASSATLAAEGDASTPKGSLCDFHTALGSVCAALSCAHNTPEFGFDGNSFPTGGEISPPRFSLLAAHSRGPPTLL